MPDKYCPGWLTSKCISPLIDWLPSSSLGWSFIKKNKPTNCYFKPMRGSIQHFNFRGCLEVFSRMASCERPRLGHIICFSVSASVLGRGQAFQLIFVAVLSYLQNGMVKPWPLKIQEESEKPALNLSLFTLFFWKLYSLTHVWDLTMALLHPAVYQCQFKTFRRNSVYPLLAKLFNFAVIATWTL